MMPHSAKLRFVAAVCLLLLAQFASAAPSTVLDRPAYLISQKRFVDAADWVAQSPNPGDLKTLCARATLCLYTDQISQARLAFTQIAALTPPSEPLAVYGQALCDLAEGDRTDAKALLAQCRALAGNTGDSEIIDLAAAAIAQSQGDPTLAGTLTSGSSLPLAQEMAAIRSLESQPDAQNGILSNPPWWLPGGVPRVVELSGIQAIGAVDPQSRFEPVVGSLASTTVGDRVVAHLFGAAQQDGDLSAKTVHGEIMLTPSSAFDWSDPNWVASYCVDGAVQSVANTGRRSWLWDTTGFANGLHAVEISLDNDALGQHFTQTRAYRIANPHPRVMETADPINRPQSLSDNDQTVIADTWQLLTLQPSYQAAELLLSRLCRTNHLSALALEHDCIAAALNAPDSAAQIAEISRAYEGRIPTWYKLPASAHAVLSHAKGPHKYISEGLWRGSSGVREIALTFDDGPSPDKTPPLLSALESVHAPATFMVVGIRAEVAPDILRRMAADGDEVEDHTYTHPNLDEATDEHIYEEILRDAAIIQACTGTWPHFLRPPGGQSNPDVLEIAAKLGLTGALWTIDALPAEDTGSPGAVVNLVLNKAVPGAVVLMHDGPYATTAAIPTLVKALRARGYRLVTLLQIAKDTPGANL